MKLTYEVKDSTSISKLASESQSTSVSQSASASQSVSTSQSTSTSLSTTTSTSHSNVGSHIDNSQGSTSADRLHSESASTSELTGNSSNKLPNTGTEASDSSVVLAALAGVTGLGLLAKRRHDENEDEA